MTTIYNVDKYKHHLEWNEYYDEDDNTYWEAAGMGDDEGYYRIRQKLKGNRVIFIEDSSPELWLDHKSRYREEWNDVLSAKYDMYREDLNIIKQNDTTGSI